MLRLESKCTEDQEVQGALWKVDALCRHVLPFRFYTRYFISCRSAIQTLAKKVRCVKDRVAQAPGSPTRAAFAGEWGRGALACGAPEAHGAGLIVLIPAILGFHQTASGVLFTKAENVAVRILDVKIEACPRSFFKRLDHLSPTHFQLAEQASDARHGNVRVQMFVLFPVFSVRGQFRRMLEMYRESVAPDARIERLILKIELEAKLVTVLRNRSVKIIDEKLRG